VYARKKNDALRNTTKREECRARLAKVLKKSEGPLLQCDYQQLMKLRREGKVPRKPKGIKKNFMRDIRRKRANHSDESSSSDPGGEYAGVWPLEKREQSIRDPELPGIESTDLDDFFGWSKFPSTWWYSEQNMSQLRTRPTGRRYWGFVGLLPNPWNPRRAFQSVKAEDMIPSLYEIEEWEYGKSCRWETVSISKGPPSCSRY